MTVIDSNSLRIAANRIIPFQFTDVAPARAKSDAADPIRFTI